MTFIVQDIYNARRRQLPPSDLRQSHQNDHSPPLQNWFPGLPTSIKYDHKAVVENKHAAHHITTDFFP